MAMRRRREYTVCLPIGEAIEINTNLGEDGERGRGRLMVSNKWINGENGVGLFLGQRATAATRGQEKSKSQNPEPKTGDEDDDTISIKTNPPEGDPCASDWQCSE